MSEQVSYRCDICQIEKQEANHWWKGYLFHGGKMGELTTGILIGPWSSQPRELHGLQHPIKENAHLCGEAHAIEWVSRQLSRRTS